MKLNREILITTKYWSVPRAKDELKELTKKHDFTFFVYLQNGKIKINGLLNRFYSENSLLENIEKLSIQHSNSIVMFDKQNKGWSSEDILKEIAIGNVDFSQNKAKFQYIVNEAINSDYNYILDLVKAQSIYEEIQNNPTNEFYKLFFPDIYNSLFSEFIIDIIKESKQLQYKSLF